MISVRRQQLGNAHFSLISTFMLHLCSAVASTHHHAAKDTGHMTSTEATAFSPFARKTEMVLIRSEDDRRQQPLHDHHPIPGPSSGLAHLIQLEEVQAALYELAKSANAVNFPKIEPDLNPIPMSLMVSILKPIP